MPRTKLTNEELAALAKWEPQMRTVVDARWVSHLPQSAIDRMLEIWEAMAGAKRPFRAGCSTCILNLVRDLGVLYFAQKPQKTAASAKKAEKVSKTTTKPKTAAKTKNSK